ncbi:MAG TPA: hypothetical protein PLQ76_01900, partial [bacterium]|nr:hypothetical protein [bacterium]
TVERYKRLSAGGWGIVYLEAIAADERGKARPGQLVLSDKNIDSFKRLADAIRAAAEPAPLIIFQLNHAGRYALKPLFAYHSELLDPTWNITPDMREATSAELDEASEAMAGAVVRAALAGADAIDLKCCHGYLAAELFRPANIRTDGYGGSYENRTRFFKAMLGAARAAAAENGVLFGARVSMQECFAGGIASGGPDGLEFDPSELDLFLSELGAAGASFTCETAGIPYLDPFVVRPWAKQENRDEALSLHHKLTAHVKRNHPGLAVIGAGYTLLGPGFAETAARNINKNEIDFIGLGRQSFADPETPKKLFGGDAVSVKWCKGCKTNNCSALLRGRAVTGCVIYDDFYKERLAELRNSAK